MVKQIVEAIRRVEKETGGEVHVHLRHFLIGDALNEAKKTFHKLKLHKTKHRNAVLIFVATKSKRFAVYGDEGIHQKVGDSFWNETRDKIQVYFKRGKIWEGIAAGVESVGEKLKIHFPARRGDANELPDQVTED